MKKMGQLNAGGGGICDTPSRWVVTKLFVHIIFHDVGKVLDIIILGAPTPWTMIL
jgi:hypothetical protein